uniref:Uncharacterized protein n=1 Tax=Arundo donax TaxID=35708 RepID=A0A0A8YT53_ARUDO
MPHEDNKFHAYQFDQQLFQIPIPLIIQVSK